jgi:hypothetical protein
MIQTPSCGLCSPVAPNTQVFIVVLLHHQDLR